jgi:hypothetical protein
MYVFIERDDQTQEPIDMEDLESVIFYLGRNVYRIAADGDGLVIEKAGKTARLVAEQDGADRVRVRAE